MWFRSNWLPISSHSWRMICCEKPTRSATVTSFFARYEGAQQVPLVRPGERDHRLAERLAGDRARVDLGAADDRVLLDHPNGASQLGRLDGALLPGGAGTDDEDVVVPSWGGRRVAGGRSEAGCPGARQRNSDRHRPGRQSVQPSAARVKLRPVAPPTTASAVVATESVSSSLLTQLREDHPEAWRRLERLYGPMILAWCRRRDVEAHAAEDIRQEVLASAARAIAGFRRDRPGDSFRGWLATIAANKIADHYRRLGRQPAATGGTTHRLWLDEAPDPGALDPDATASLSPLRADDRGALVHRAAELVRAEFEPATWDAFWLTTTEQLTPQEAAERLGVSTNAVYKARSRVLRRLRRELDAID